MNLRAQLSGMLWTSRIKSRHEQYGNGLKYKFEKVLFLFKLQVIVPDPKLYIPSTPNNSNETHTSMCLGRTGRFGQL